MSIKMGSIVVDLTANTVSFSGAMDKAAQVAFNSSRNIQRSLSLISVAASTMAASVMASLTAAIGEAENFAFSVQRSAEQVGTSSEMYSKLAYSAKLAGAPVDDLRYAMERMARTSGSAQSGNKQAVAAYAALGISVKDLQGPLKDSGNLFVAAAKSLDQFKDSTNKTALEQKIFGRSGAELAPLIKQVAEGFDTASEQATLFGVVVGDKTAAQARQLHTSLVQLESVALGFSTRLLSDVSPALNDVATQLIKVATSGDGMKVIDTVARDIATAVRATGDVFQFLVDHATAVKVVLEGLAALKFGSLFVPMIASAVVAGKSLGDVGVVALRMIGRILGISQIAKVFGPLITGAIGYTGSLFGLARTEGIVATGALAMEDAWAGFTATVAANPVGVVLAATAGGLYIVKKAMDENVDSAKKFGDSAVTWHDYWQAAIDNSIRSLEDMKTVLLSFSMKDIQNAIADYRSIPDFGVHVHQIANQRVNNQKTTPDVTAPKTPKLDAPVLQTEQKVDPLTKKLAELASAAREAQVALANAGKGTDFERQAEIAAEYSKVITALEPQLAKLSESQRRNAEEQIAVSIATAVNDKAQREFLNGVAQATREIEAQTAAHNALTDAVGKSSAEVRRAQVESQINQKYANASDVFKNSIEGQAQIAGERAALYRSMSAQDAQTDKQNLANVQEQINAQMRLNQALLQSKAIRDAAALSTQQDEIRRQFSERGDTNSQDLKDALDANQRLFETKQKQSDLERASSLVNPAKAYQDQAQAIRDAESAAREYGIALDEMQIKAANKSNLEQYREAIDKAKLAVGGLTDGVTVFFDQMNRDTESAAQKVHDVLGRAFEDLNSTLVKLVEGQKTSFADFFRSIAGDLARLAIQNTEKGLIGLITGAARGQQGSTSSSSSSSQSSNAGSFLSKAIGIGSSLFGFGGHFAQGGDVVAGMSYDVGEMGRETFTPTVNGRITPNNKLGGDTAIHIDARGANDPAQTEAAIHRAMNQYAPHIVAASLKAHSESQKRRPSTAPR